MLFFFFLQAGIPFDIFLKGLQKNKQKNPQFCSLLTANNYQATCGKDGSCGSVETLKRQIIKN